MFLEKLIGKTVTIYMKSGNKIKLYFIENLKINDKGNSITYLHVEKMWFFKYVRFNHLMIESIDLSQIEAIVHS